MVGDVLRRRGVVRALTIGMVAVLALPFTPAHAATGVRTTRALEFGPAAGPGVFAWTQAPRSRPSAFRALATLPGGATVRLSARGTKGFVGGGGVDDSGKRIAYWQHRGGNGNIKIFRVATRRRTSVGLVNTAAHEWGASLSGNWLLFARGRYGGSMKVFLANLQAKTVRRVARVGSGGFVQPGDVTGSWATWMTCSGFRNCRVVRLNLSNGNRRLVPNPLGRSQFSPSVLANGTVYYGESRNYNTCSTRTRVYRDPTSSSRTRVTTLPSGTSIGWTSVKRVSSIRADVFYDQVVCSSGSSNIYRVRAAD